MVNAALCQTIGRSSIQASTDNMEAMIRQAVQGHPDLDLIVFPEYCYGFPNTIGSHPEIGDHTRRIAALAKEHHVYILAGSFPVWQRMAALTTPSVSTTGTANWRGATTRPTCA